MSDQTPAPSACPECGAERDYDRFNSPFGSNLGWECGSYEENWRDGGPSPIRKSVRCGLRHWERRALAAEAEVARLRGMLRVAADVTDTRPENIEKWMDGMTGGNP